MRSGQLAQEKLPGEKNGRSISSGSSSNDPRGGSHLRRSRSRDDRGGRVCKRSGSSSRERKERSNKSRREKSAGVDAKGNQHGSDKKEDILSTSAENKNFTLPPIGPKGVVLELTSSEGVRNQSARSIHSTDSAIASSSNAAPSLRTTADKDPNPIMRDDEILDSFSNFVEVRYVFICNMS
jgi:hypothetical protein